ncbi:transketolase [Nautilia profundicola AmH]|uniref:Transketolase n=1 Tax=Nautilia profundicola (strain ATCC BAA-1463 / DSM 18972 / AmH) TaxID=598659 RepID=B9L6S7_NAUPA|nr:transketolase [Nautilia profundicola]ACM92752.1 transketolase [Nautilia profundicola AmH]
MNLRKKMADTIRFLAADMVQKANSGHPGAALGLADIMTVFSEVVNITPHNPEFVNRDRVVFSGGHATPLIYSMLFLWGYDITLDDLKNFRQLGSKTPGHPEFGHTPGIEVTTGPLGQGVANAVGFAKAKKFMSLKFPEINHKVWCFCGDGDLEEGISYEACSLAGKHKLEDLIIIYDSNNISIEGEVSIAFDEDVQKRFESQGFRVLEMNGHDYEDIEKKLNEAKNSDGRPTLIIAKTVIARGAVGLEGSEKTHGAPLGEDVIKKSKEAAGFDPEKTFIVPEDVLVRFRCVKERGEVIEAEFNKKANAGEIKAFFEKDFSKIKWPEFEEGASIATRKSNGEILNAIAKAVPSFLGGSADLAPSNNTILKDEDDFPHGRNLHYGIREHAMAAINNAFSAYGFLPYAATFLVFSDYLRGALRIAALSSHKNYWIFTHDSIVVGEDGPTHQPVEHITSLRAIPNLYVFRPADANENVNAWKAALDIDAPVVFALSRQGLRNISPKDADLSKGAYILREGNSDITLVASGSEVNLAVDVAKRLDARVVSVPCFDLFDEQDEEFKSSLFKGRVIAIEANRAFEWYKYADEVIGMNTFGASGKGGDVYKHFGFDVDAIVERIEK